jgi:signal transduction histidine kinase
MSLRSKMILAFVLLVFLVAGSLIVFIGFDNARQVRNFILRGGVYGVQDTVDALETFYETHASWDGVENMLTNQLSMPMMGNAAQGNGQAMGNSMGPGRREPFTLTDSNLMVVWSANGEQVGQTLTSQSKNNGIELTDKAGKTIGYLFVSGRSALQASEVSPLLTTLRNTLIRVSLIAVFLAILFAILFTNRLTKPINNLTNAAKTLSQGNLSIRVNESGKDEIAVLGKSFNEMADSLQKSEERKKAMTADIAHELRSPLAVQRAQIEAMQDGIVPLSVESLQTVLDQTNFLARLVDDLRTLALVDAGELPLEKTEIDLEELVGQVVERFQPKVAQQNVNLRIDNELIDGNLKIFADPDRIVQILSNLISNALHHTPGGGTILIKFDENESEVFCLVQDSGCGIKEEDLPHLFERFYRGDKARSHEFSSTGLGLSIARNLARVHGGDLTAANAQQGGAVFTLQLPKLDK